jgi:thioredoxin reductase
MEDVVIVEGNFAGLFGSPQLGRARLCVTIVDLGRAA